MSKRKGDEAGILLRTNEQKIGELVGKIWAGGRQEKGGVGLYA